MNDFQQQNEDEALQIDRLVDGELSESERHELLLRFDQDPAGWRRCALGFLEAQSWRTEFHELTSPALVQPIATQASKEATAWNQALGRLFTVAAVAMITVGLTLLVRDRLAAPEIGAEGEERLAQQMPTAADERAERVQPPIAERGGNEPLTLVFEQSPSAPSQVFQVPLVDAERFGAELNDLESSPPIPAGVRGLLERLGHRIENRRRFAPVELDDGSQYLVPVDDVHIYPAVREMQ